jgi:hypothetical protein
VAQKWLEELGIKTVGDFAKWGANQRSKPASDVTEFGFTNSHAASTTALSFSIGRHNPSLPRDTFEHDVPLLESQIKSIENCA